MNPSSEAGPMALFLCLYITCCDISKCQDTYGSFWEDSYCILTWRKYYDETFTFRFSVAYSLSRRALQMC